MTRDQVFMYSPLSPASANTERARGLLLQFILRELIQAQEGALLYVKRSCFFPNDWSQEVGCLNRLEEHLQLLAYAFPELSKESASIEKLMAKLLAQWNSDCPKKLFAALLPFLAACAGNENFLFFLLQHQKTLAQFSSTKKLKSFFPEEAEKNLVEAFTARGFSTRAKESQALLKTLYEPIPVLERHAF